MRESKVVLNIDIIAIQMCRFAGVFHGQVASGNKPLLDGRADPAPENLAERAARNSPRTVVLIDAADFDGEPGELRLVDPEELGWTLGGATHAPSLELLATYLKERCDARTIMLVAQPASTEFGTDISPALKGAASRAASILRFK